MAPPNTLMPAGIPITAGYDSIHPFGMRSLSGLAWEFPGTTHFLGRSDEHAPADWAVVWSKGDWRLWENPNPSMGEVVFYGSEEAVTLAPKDVKRPTHNTMLVSIPKGAAALTVFYNWHRGWRWRAGPDEEWRRVRLGDNRTMYMEFIAPERAGSKIYLRYDPISEPWAFYASFLSLILVVIIVLRPQIIFRVKASPKS
jgi:hypothetical protein